MVLLLSPWGQLSAVSRVWDLLILVQLCVWRIMYALRLFKFVVDKHYCKAHDESRIPVSDGSWMIVYLYTRTAVLHKYICWWFSYVYIWGKMLWSGHFSVQKETVVVHTFNAKICGSFVTNSSILCKCFICKTHAECWMLPKLERFEALRAVFMKTQGLLEFELWQLVNGYYLFEVVCCHQLHNLCNHARKTDVFWRNF